MVAGRALPTPVAEPEDLAGPRDDGRGTHVVARPAVADGVDAARVVRDHAADRGDVGAPTRGRRKEEAVGTEPPVQLGVDDARLDRKSVV